MDKFIKLHFEIESNRLKDSIAEHIVYNWEDPTTEAPLPTTEDEFTVNDFDSSPFGSDDEDLPW